MPAQTANDSRVIYDPSKAPNGYTAYSGADAETRPPTAPRSASTIDGLALAPGAQGYVQPKRFVCPSAPRRPTRS